MRSEGGEGSLLSGSVLESCAASEETERFKWFIQNIITYTSLYIHNNVTPTFLYYMLQVLFV